MRKHKLPFGVYKTRDEDKFHVKISCYGKTVRFGVFTDLLLAAQVLDDAYEVVWDLRPNGTADRQPPRKYEELLALRSLRVHLTPFKGGGKLTGSYVEFSDGKRLTLAAEKWNSMMSRLAPKSVARNPTYAKISVCDEWRDFTKFNEWFSSQPAHRKQKGWELDKDLLGGLEYNSQNCLLLPKDINMFTVKCDASRGQYPIGVSYVKDRDLFVASLSYGGKKRKLGNHSTPEIAFAVYKKYKEAYGRELAEKWKDEIDPRAYEALMCYNVGITD